MSKKTISLLLVCMISLCGIMAAFAEDNTEYSGTPYGGTAPALTVSGSLSVEAEAYDEGGYGVAFGSTTGANVDAPNRERYITGYKGITLNTNQWFNYTVDVKTAGYYKITFISWASRQFTNIDVDVNGTEQIDNVNITAGDKSVSNNFPTSSDYIGYIKLDAGINVITMRNIGEYCYFDKFTLSDYGTSEPYKKNIITTASEGNKIEFEHYDVGGQNNAYYSTSTEPSTSGGRVGELEGTAALTGATALSLTTSEWVKFTVEAQEEGGYELDVAAWINQWNNRTITVYVNDAKVVDQKPLTAISEAANDYIPHNNDKIGYINLKKGKNTIKFENSSGYYYPDYFTLTKMTATVPYTDKSICWGESLKMWAKDFDYGGRGLAYMNSVKNVASAYRPGELVGFANLSNQPVSTGNGDWYKYTIDSVDGGNYYFTLNAAAVNGDAVVNVYVNDVLVLENKTIPNNGKDANGNLIYTIKQNKLGPVEFMMGPQIIKIERVSGVSLYIESFELTTPINKVNAEEKNGTLIASGSLYNLTDTELTGYIIIAAYSENKLLSINFKPLTAAADSYSNGSISIEKPNEAVKVKAFLWNSFPATDISISDEVPIETVN